VSVLGPDGAELCRHSDAQHNRNYSTRMALMDQLADDALAALALAATTESDAEAEDGCAQDAEGAQVTQDAEGAEHELSTVTEEAESCELPPRKSKATKAADRVFSRGAAEGIAVALADMFPLPSPGLGRVEAVRSASG